jgi:hypothetical protein
MVQWRYGLLSIALVCAACLAGCGGEPFKTVSVSGKVTLEGEPLSLATVTFRPVAPGPNGLAPTSYGKTDESGEFSLKLISNDSNGAVVGKHRVEITVKSAAAEEAEESDVTPEAAHKETKIPSRYNTDSELTFDVPSGGTGEANFDLKIN